MLLQTYLKIVEKISDVSGFCVTQRLLPQTKRECFRVGMTPFNQGLFCRAREAFSLVFGHIKKRSSNRNTINKLSPVIIPAGINFPDLLYLTPITTERTPDESNKTLMSVGSFEVL